MIQVQLPDGSIQEHSDDATALDVAQSIGERLARATVAAEVEGRIVDARRPLAEATDSRPVPLRLITERDREALDVMRHSCAHVMARAVMRLYPGTSLAFGPTLAHGYYYDFDLPEPLREEDFERIEEEMAEIVKEAEPFERFVLPRDEARQFCDDLEQDLKVEHIDSGLAEHSTVSFYRQGEFVDLCRGPHVPDAGRIKAFKLLSVAGSYWKGDAKNRRLQRLYGTAFFDKKDLSRYLEQVEEAKRRDHRVLGKQLKLFEIDPDVGQGLILWKPRGTQVRAVLEEFLRVEMVKRGYDLVATPHIGRVDLYEISGHFPYYRDSQFAPIFGHEGGQLVDAWIRRLREVGLSSDDESRLVQAAKVLGVDTGEYQPAASTERKIEVLRKWEKSQERFLLKPMNCPHHVKIYASEQRSYRDLPLRLAEFGTVYRHEKSGELNGMTRVRGFTQDDAHLFCTPDQVKDEFRATVELVQFVFETFGFRDVSIRLSLRDPHSDKYVGRAELWDRAESELREVLAEMKVNFVEEVGEAAFYGPKVDFVIRDVIGRPWQLGTVQLDYNLPERFELEYIGADNHAHRPVMIHRAPFGSMERFVGILIEHFAGAFPLWLAPEQVRVLPLSDKTLDYAREVESQLRAAGFRATTDAKSAKVNAKIRDAQLELIPYMMVVGPREAEAGAVALRDRLEGDLGSMPLADAIQKLQAEVAGRTIRQVVQTEFQGIEATGDGEQHEY
ncbi:MAG: threonine--tRNA ligase [Planctomycetaceae bacterium]